MQIDLSKYLKQKFTILYDNMDAKRIVREHKLSSNLEDIEFVAPKEVLSITRSFLRIILQDRVSQYPNEKDIKKTTIITTRDSGLKQKFKETLNELIKERKEVDTKLRIRVNYNERNDTNTRNKLLH